MAENIEEILAEIDEAEIEEYQRFFDMFDRSRNGYIMATQLASILDSMEQDYDEKTLRKLIRKFDADGSGKLEFDEFCALVYTVANSVDKETLRNELKEAFRLFDKEGNGYISTQTLKELLHEIAPDLSDAELDAAVDEIDEDGSGKIEFEANLIDPADEMAPSVADQQQEDSQQQPLIVTYAGRHYDISGFVKRHPGGQRVLRTAAGSDVDSFMAGNAELGGLRHEHSEAAYEILSRYSLDQQFKKDPLVDGKEPMLWKVGELHERYWTWIHQPYDGVLRLFHSDLLEQLTRTKWWMIPLVWMPIVVVYVFFGLSILCNDFGTFGGALLGLLIFATGTLAWTLLEYTLHRGVFHWHPDPRSYGQITLHFLLHGLHHKTPMDPDRLVFPPAAALLIIGSLYTFYRAMLPFPIFCCFATGKLFGYIVYDLSHYYLHHGQPSLNSRWQYRKVYHHNHHFKDSDSCFGISTTLWDRVFGTTDTTGGRFISGGKQK